MTFYLADDLSEWLALTGQLITLAIGMALFVLPHRILRHFGVKGVEGHPEATGEGRSSFAGFPLGLSACALLFGQPVLTATLGLAWALAVLGGLLQIGVDGARAMSVLVRTAVAAVVAAACLASGEFPTVEPAFPQNVGEWLIFAVAAITVIFGLIGLLMPARGLAIMRLSADPDHRGAQGEARGTLAGFYLAVGLAIFLFGNLFITLALAAGWLATAFGRLVTILSDRANNMFNWVSLAIELALAGVPLGVIFGLFG